MNVSGENLSIHDVNAIATRGEYVELDSMHLQKVVKSWERVQAWGRDKYPMYGVNTGFGELAHVIIPPEFKSELQLNLLRSHAAGGGELFPDEVVRAIMVSRLNCVMKGYSGASAEAAILLREFLNRRIHPVVPQQGSLGASGDLATLAHVSLPLIAEGEVRVGGQIRPTCEVMREQGLKPLELGYKEALALINGTSGMTGAACLALVRGQNMLKYAVLLSAAYVQCLRGATRAFDDRGHQLKNHHGQIVIARALMGLLEGSKLTQEHAKLMSLISHETGGQSGVVDTEIFLQNAYTLRCIPQILGPVVDTFNFCRKMVEEELNSCNDNPLIFDSPQESFHGGNFHGQYVAMACDYLNIGLTEIGVLVDRQLNRLLDPHLNGTLPPFLADGAGGLFCGYEGAQYLATSIAAENLDLAAPSSIKSIPSNGSNQDVVSMGLISARKSLRLLDNLSNMMAVMSAACYQASLFTGPELFSPVVQQLFSIFGKHIAGYKDDIPMYRIIAKARELLMGDEMCAFVDFHVNFEQETYSQQE